MFNIKYIQDNKESSFEIEYDRCKDSWYWTMLEIIIKRKQTIYFYEIRLNKWLKEQYL
jgi:hypothetical protein